MLRTTRCVFGFVLFLPTVLAMQCGGTQAQEIGDDVKALLAEMTPAVEAATQQAGRNGSVQKLAAVAHMTQVVAGVNHLIKARINDDDEYIFVCIYDRFGDKQVTQLKVGVGADEQLVGRWWH